MCTTVSSPRPVPTLCYAAYGGCAVYAMAVLSPDPRYTYHGVLVEGPGGVVYIYRDHGVQVLHPATQATVST